MLKPYTQLKRAAKGKLTANKNELHVWDRRFLLSPDAPRSFVWLLRPTGTHLFPAYEPNDRPSPLMKRVAQHWRDTLQHIYAYCTLRGEEFDCYIFEEGMLREATLIECCNFLKRRVPQPDEP